MKFDKVWVKPSSITSYVASQSSKATSVQIHLECGTTHRILMSQDEFKIFEEQMAKIGEESSISLASKWIDFANGMQPVFEGYMPSGEQDLDLEPLQYNPAEHPDLAVVPEEDKDMPKPPRKNTKKDA